MWYVATYAPVSLISLKLATATSTGGKSLLLPTPYALKMALLNVAIQNSGLAMGEAIWPSLRDAKVAVRGPAWITVNNTFTKILKPMKGKPELDPETGLTRALINSVGFREYVQWQGELQVALDVENPDAPWARWLALINYIGKRGGFIQVLERPVENEALASGFVDLSTAATDFPLYGTMQLMDDCTPDLSFEQVNVYTDKRVTRVLRNVTIPYQVAGSSRGYTLYRRLN
ncbi:MAG: hypothetical protein IAE81_01740 [Caldilineaceae bacterium]|jgi:hypothetical protein|nr:hypothetical protein [Caldilineaceae bacterium]